MNVIHNEVIYDGIVPHCQAQIWDHPVTLHEFVSRYGDGEPLKLCGG